MQREVRILAKYIPVYSPPDIENYQSENAGQIIFCDAQKLA